MQCKQILDIQFIQRKINKQNYEHFLEPKILYPYRTGKRFDQSLNNMHQN